MGSIYIYINKSNTVAPAAAATVLARLASRLCPCPCPCSHVLVLQHATPAAAKVASVHATPAAAKLHASPASVHATPAAAKVLLHASRSMHPVAVPLSFFGQALLWLFLHGVKTI